MFGESLIEKIQLLYVKHKNYNIFITFSKIKKNIYL